MAWRRKRDRLLVGLIVAGLDRRDFSSLDLLNDGQQDEGHPVHDLLGRSRFYRRHRTCQRDAIHNGAVSIGYTLARALLQRLEMDHQRYDTSLSRFKRHPHHHHQTTLQDEGSTSSAFQIFTVPSAPQLTTSPR